MSEAFPAPDKSGANASAGCANFSWEGMERSDPQRQDLLWGHAPRKWRYFGRMSHRRLSDLKPPVIAVRWIWSINRYKDKTRERTPEHHLYCPDLKFPNCQPTCRQKLKSIGVVPGSCPTTSPQSWKKLNLLQWKSEIKQQFWSVAGNVTESCISRGFVSLYWGCRRHMCIVQFVESRFELFLSVSLKNKTVQVYVRHDTRSSLWKELLILVRLAV